MWALAGGDETAGEAIHVEGPAASKCPVPQIHARFAAREALTHESKSAPGDTAPRDAKPGNGRE
jgi:hypothetical protein